MLPIDENIIIAEQTGQLQQAVEKGLQTQRAWFLGAISECWEIYLYGRGVRLKKKNPTTKHKKQSEEFSKSLNNIKAAVVLYTLG